jgi:hypothetical protein
MATTGRAVMEERMVDILLADLAECGREKPLSG